MDFTVEKDSNFNEKQWYSRSHDGNPSPSDMHVVTFGDPSCIIAHETRN